MGAASFKSGADADEIFTSFGVDTRFDLPDIVTAIRQRCVIIALVPIAMLRSCRSRYRIYAKQNCPRIDRAQPIDWIAQIIRSRRRSKTQTRRS
jgi:hypothetical protein